MKDIIRSAELLDIIYEEDENFSGKYTVDEICAMMDDASNLCPHPTMMRDIDNDAPNAEAWVCYECGNQHFIQI